MPWNSGDSLNSNNLNFKAGSASYNPKSYGAVADDTTNSTSGIQAAVTAAAAALVSSGTDKSTAIVDLDGGRYAISSALTFADVFGLTIRNGVVRALASFDSSTGYLLKIGNDNSSVDQSTNRVVLENVTLDAARVAGVGCLYMVNHGKSLLDNCQFRRPNTYGLRSVNGAGLTNELIVRNCRGAEWYGDGSDTTTISASNLSSTMVRIEHNDTILEGNVFGSGRTGISVTGQFNRISGNHVYTGYRINGTAIPALPCFSEEGFHNLWEGNYVDNGCFRALNLFDSHIVNNQFLQATSNTTHGFIDLYLTTPAAMEDVVIAFNTFQNNGTANVSMVTFSNNGTKYSATPSTDWQRRNLIDYNGSASSASLLFHSDFVTNVEATATLPTMGFASERSLGWYRSAASTMALSYGTLQVNGQVLLQSSAAITNLFMKVTNTEVAGMQWGLTVEPNAGQGLLGFYNLRDNVQGPQISTTGHIVLPRVASFASATAVPSAASATGYLYADSTSSLYWVNGSGVSKLVA